MLFEPIYCSTLSIPVRFDFSTALHLCSIIPLLFQVNLTSSFESRLTKALSLKSAFVDENETNILCLILKFVDYKQITALQWSNHTRVNMKYTTKIYLLQWPTLLSNKSPCVEVDLCIDKNHLNS